MPATISQDKMGIVQRFEFMSCNPFPGTVGAETEKTSYMSGEKTSEVCKNFFVIFKSPLYYQPCEKFYHESLFVLSFPTGPSPKGYQS